MKKRILNSLWLLFCVGFILPLELFSLDVSVSTARFRSGDQCYIEISFQVIGQSIVFEKAQDSIHYQASADIFIRLESEGEIINFHKYRLKSPLTKTVVDFIDLQRMSLPAGDTELIIEIQDVHKTGNVFEYRRMLQTQEFNPRSSQSEIQLLATVKNAKQESAFSKQGVEFEILPYEMYHDAYDQLIVYQELYDLYLETASGYYLGAFVYQGYEGERGTLALKKFKRVTPGKVTPVLMHLDIKDLISGNYHIVMELRNDFHEVLNSVHKNFQRVNPDADLRLRRRYNKEFELSFVQKLQEEDLTSYLKMHRPLVSAEWAAILSKLVDDGDSRSKRHFLYTLWMDEAPMHPEKSFIAYLNAVEKVNKMFYNNVGHGYDTDRGYIYLKYGVPNDVLTVEDEPSAPPYEIWKYNYLERTGQSNVKFLFYNPSLAHNDFHLLHSTCRGELDNPTWEITLYKNAPAERLNDFEMMDNFGRNARRYFNEF